MGRLTKQQDAYGQAMWDAIDDPQAACVIEREDGFVDVDHTRHYMSEFKDWARHERQGLSLARGRVLDVGCGAGRVGLYLQEKGLDVLGIDNSPSAIKACKQRGLKKAKVMSITQVSRRLGVFDTIVMYGNNFGLFGSFKRARRLLRRFHAMTSLPGRIIAQTNDPHLPPGQKPRSVVEKCHLAYRRANVRRGRMAGQIRFRIRYHDLCTPYLDYLFVSRDEMREIVDGTGWKISRFFDSKGSVYIAVLEKEQ
ncbi:MAG: class I SAM-dependent methyltransferase [Planctomycetota bacterium]|nr:class I SAM-dependent methyltransferase [Planctomycetota bacterium]